jgi:alkylation response protein AidB-like acyl-CoA dehydrogenase
MAILSEEQTLIRDMAQNWVSNEQPVTAFRSLRDGAPVEGINLETYAQIVEMGWTGIIVPEDLGGVDVGYRTMGLVLEQMGHNLVVSPLPVSALGVTSALILAGTDTQKEKWLPQLVSGEVIGTLAIDDGPVHNLNAITTTATEDGDKWTLNGTKQFVAESGSAQLFVAAAKTNDGLALFLVQRNTDGVAISQRQVADARSHGEVCFTNVSLDGDALLGSTNGDLLVDQVLDRMRAGSAAEMLGMCDEAFTATLEYLKTRKQFDRPLASFQALQHRMAHLYTELELLRSVVEHTFGVLDAGKDDNAIAAQASLAKTLANDTLHLMTNEMLQLHGGIGLTDEHDAGFYLKRARSMEIAWGNSSHLSDRYGRLVCEL